MIVIAGGGLAAQRCCERLRRRGYDGPLTLVCDEPYAPYDRPPLSKEFLSGELAEPPRLRPDDWYAQNDVGLILGRRVARLRPHESALELDDGANLLYDKLLIATGARPRMLPGSERFENVHVLRTRADAERLRDAIAPAVRLAVVGAGFIGQEVAATARKRGAEVTLIEALPAPLARITGELVGSWFAGLHASEGVDVRVGVPLGRICGNGKARRITLADGARIDCDEVVVGIGVAPAVEWLADSGIDPRRADAAGRTAAPEVFAAGDCTGSQHWEAAVQQGAAAAMAMLGDEPPAPAPTSFWSDLYGTRVNWVGRADGADEVEIDGDQDARDFAAVYRRDGEPVAALLVGRPQQLPELRRLIHPQRKEQQ